MAKQSESESQELKALKETPVVLSTPSFTPKATKQKTEQPMLKVSQISSRSLPASLVAVSEKLQQDLVSNQAYIVNGVFVLWAGPLKKIFYGPDALEASGDTMVQAVTAAKIA